MIIVAFLRELPVWAAAGARRVRHLRIQWSDNDAIPGLREAPSLPMLSASAPPRATIVRHVAAAPGAGTVHRLPAVLPFTLYR
jgi:hypothetical protein